MRRSHRFLAVFLLLLATPLRAQSDPPELGWNVSAELTLVVTGGNAEATTLGFRNELQRLWSSAELKVEASGLRAESTTTTRLAIGTPSDFVVIERSESELTAENYHLRARYDRRFAAHLEWFGGGGWERNELAGVRNRFVASAGIGHLWWKRDEAHLRSSYGVTLTRQEDVTPSADDARTFAGLRAAAEISRPLTPTTRYDGNVVFDLNLDATDDLRADLVQAVAVSISARLALKTSVELRYDNKPALTRVPLLQPDGEPTGTSVLAPLERVDALARVALVVTF